MRNSSKVYRSMKFAVYVVITSLVAASHADLLHDVLAPLKTFGSGVLQTAKQVLPYSLQVGKQLIKDTTATILKGLGQEVTALVSAPVKLLFGKRDLNVLRDLMSEAEHVVSSVLQFQELLEHEFNNVAAGGHVGSAVQRLDDLLVKVHDVVNSEIKHVLHL